MAYPAADLFFWVALGLGLVMIWLFAYERFDQPYPGHKYLEQLHPRHLSARSQFLKAFLIYIAVLSLAYVSACLLLVQARDLWPVVLGDEVAAAMSAALSGAAAVPLAVAFLMVGVLPNARHFDRLEGPLRRLSHRLIGIPSGLPRLEAEIARTPLAHDRLTMAERDHHAGVLQRLLGHRLAKLPDWSRTRLMAWLQAAGDDPESLDRADAALSAEDRQVLAQLREECLAAKSVAEAWHRARVLYLRLQDGSATHHLAAETGEKYGKLSEDISRSHAEIAAIVARTAEDAKQLSELLGAMERARGAVAQNTDLDDADIGRVKAFLEELLNRRLGDVLRLGPRIEELLAKLHLFIAAGVILLPNRGVCQEALAALGLARTEPPEPDPVDDVLLAVLSMGAAVFVFNLLAQTVWPEPGSTAPALVVALRVLVSGLILHGSAAMIAYAWRRRRTEARRWKVPFEAGIRLPVRQYLGLGLLIFAPAYLCMLAWTILLIASARGRVPSLAELAADSTLASLVFVAFSGVLTGIFTARNLDIASRTRMPRPARLRRAGLQGLCTATALLVAAAIQVPGTLAWDIGLSGFIIGATMGASVLIMAGRRDTLDAPPPVVAAAVPAG